MYILLVHQCTLYILLVHQMNTKWSPHEEDIIPKLLQHLILLPAMISLIFNFGKVCKTPMAEQEWQNGSVMGVPLIDRRQKIVWLALQAHKEIMKS